VLFILLFLYYMDILAAKVIAAGLCMGIGSIAPAIAEGMVASKAMEAIGRNPAVSDKIIPNMVVAMAICESTGIYALVISLIILFAV
jgi:F-type H+-transporting ATPase subunit c